MLYPTLLALGCLVVSGFTLNPDLDGEWEAFKMTHDKFYFKEPVETIRYTAHFDYKFT